MNRLFPVLLATLVVSLALAEDASRPLTLPEAIRLALQKNPDLATAQQRVNAARAGLQQADSALLPHVRVSESYVGSDNPVQAFMMTLNQRAFSLNADFNHPDTTDNLNTKLLAQWSLYDGGTSFAGRQAAKLNSEAAAQSLDAARNDLVFEVARSYYTVNKARQFVHAAAAAVSSIEADVNVASNRVAAGQALKTDLLDAQVRLAEARENRVRAQSAAALSETIFRNVLGVGETDNVTAAESTIISESPATEDTSRPELLAAQKAVAAAGQQVRAAQGGYIPRLNAFASYDLDSGNAQQFYDSWIAGVSVDLDVFDGFLTRGKVAEARANLDASREQLRKTELMLALETKQARLNVDDARARLDTSSQTVAQAEESLRLTKERYAGGLALFTQVLGAESALTGARQRRAAAEADYLIARAALDRALGKIWKE
jgi:outer membrane protein